MMDNAKKYPHIILKRNPDRDKFIDAIKDIGFQAMSTIGITLSYSTNTQLWVKDNFELKLTNKNVEFDGEFYEYNESEILFRNLKIKNII